jgi:hypothetical protein
MQWNYVICTLMTTSLPVCTKPRTSSSSFILCLFPPHSKVEHKFSKSGFPLSVHSGAVCPCDFDKSLQPIHCHPSPTFASCLLRKEAMIQLKPPALLDTVKGHSMQWSLLKVNHPSWRPIRWLRKPMLAKPRVTSSPRPHTETKPQSGTQQAFAAWVLLGDQGRQTLRSSPVGDPRTWSALVAL